MIAELRNMLTFKILEGFDVDELDVRSVDRYHLFSEAWRLASADVGAYRADQSFHDVPFQGLLNEEYLQERRALIDPEKRLADVSPGNPWAYQVGGAYATGGHVPQYIPETNPKDMFKTNSSIVVDAEGNIVAITVSLGVAWYAGNTVPGYGYMLPVIQSYFDKDPSDPRGVNVAEPNKRVPSALSMLPNMLLKYGKPVMVASTPGSQIAPFNVMLNMLEYDMDIAEAVAEPRVSGTSWEDGISEEVLRELKDMGWKMKEKWSDQGCVQIIYRVGNEWITAADARRDGCAMGVTIEEPITVK